MSRRAQCADVKKVLRSVHKVIFAGTAIASDSGRSFTQNKETGQKMRMNYEEGQYVTHLLLPAQREEAKEETERVLKGKRFAVLAIESDQAFSRRA